MDDRITIFDGIVIIGALAVLSIYGYYSLTSCKCPWNCFC